MCTHCAKKWDSYMLSHLTNDGPPKEIFHIEGVELELYLSEVKYKGPLIFFENGLLYLATWEKSTATPLGGIIAAFGGALGAALLFPVLDRLNKPKEIDSSLVEEAIKVSPYTDMFRREDIISITHSSYGGLVIETCFKEFSYTRVPKEFVEINASNIRNYVQPRNTSH
jgi:hypothetical protein